jgi:hypothetical protein
VHCFYAIKQNLHEFGINTSNEMEFFLPSIIVSFVIVKKLTFNYLVYLQNKEKKNKIKLAFYRINEMYCLIVVILLYREEVMN